MRDNGEDARAATGPSVADAGWPGPGRVLLALAVYAGVVLLFWDGIGSSDGQRYIGWSIELSEDFFQLGTDHQLLRHPLIWPMAWCLMLLGPGELAATLPMIVYCGVVVVVSLLFGHRWMGPRAGLALAVLVATCPMMVSDNLSVRIGAAEMAFTVPAVWFALEGMLRGGRGGLIAAGVMAGIGWMCRETAAFLVPLFGLLGLIALLRGMGLRHALTVAVLPMLGFLAVLGTELLAYWLVTGDPLHRAKLSMGHGQNFESGVLIEVRRGDYADLLLEPLRRISGNAVALWYIVLGLASGAVLLWLRRSVPGVALLVAGVFALAGLHSYVLSTMIMSLENPRYYVILVYAPLPAIALALAALRPRVGALATGGALAGLALAGLFAGDFRGPGDLVRARMLAATALKLDEPVVGQNVAIFEAKLVLRLAGHAREEVEAMFVEPEDARPGMPVLLTPPLDRSGKVALPGPNTPVALVPYPETSTTRRLIRRYAPPPMNRIAGRPEPPVRLYRLPDA